VLEQSTNETCIDYIYNGGSDAVVVSDARSDDVVPRRTDRISVAQQFRSAARNVSTTHWATSVSDLDFR